MAVVVVELVGAEAASEEELLEVEYLLLALDFGEILLLFAAFGPLQAALLQVFEAGGHGGALGRPRRVTAVLWGPGDTSSSTQCHLHQHSFALRLNTNIRWSWKCWSSWRREVWCLFKRLDQHCCTTHLKSELIMF